MPHRVTREVVIAVADRLYEKFHKRYRFTTFEAVRETKQFFPPWVKKPRYKYIYFGVLVAYLNDYYELTGRPTLVRWVSHGETFYSFRGKFIYEQRHAGLAVISADTGKEVDFVSYSQVHRMPDVLGVWPRERSRGLHSPLHGHRYPYTSLEVKENDLRFNPFARRANRDLSDSEEAGVKRAEGVCEDRTKEIQRTSKSG